jgi:hypothetical protein
MDLGETWNTVSGGKRKNRAAVFFPPSKGKKEEHKQKDWLADCK